MSSIESLSASQPQSVGPLQGQPEPIPAERLFDYIVCGIDNSERSREAARQAACLLAPDGSLHLRAVVDAAKSVRAESVVPSDPEGVVESLRLALAETVAEVRPSSSQLSKGCPATTLLHLLQEEQATLVALGAPHRGRAAGIVTGSVATVLLHEAPCSVLLARAPRSQRGSPERLVVGVDGSSQAAAAAAVARALRARFGAWLFSVAALGGKPIDQEQVGRQHRGVIFDARAPVDALLAAAESADLLVVGNRGLHGLRALGSVSERTAHLAPCSVLVVRGVEEDPSS